MSVLMEFSMYPVDKGESLSLYVGEILQMIRAFGVDYQLTPMGTIIETETVPEAMVIVEKAEQLLSRQECQRIYSSIKLDIRAGQSGRLRKKVKSVEGKIGKVNS